MDDYQKASLRFALSVVSGRVNRALSPKEYKLLDFHLTSSGTGTPHIPTWEQVRERAEEIVYQAIVSAHEPMPED